MQLCVSILTGIFAATLAEPAAMCEPCIWRELRGAKGGARALEARGVSYKRVKSPTQASSKRVGRRCGRCGYNRVFSAFDRLACV